MSVSKYRFLDIFQENSDGSLTPKIKINVNGVVLSDGVSIGKGVQMGGIDFHQYKYLDIAGEYVGDTFMVQGFFKNQNG